MLSFTIYPKVIEVEVVDLSAVSSFLFSIFVFTFIILYKVRIATHPNWLAAETFNTLNMDRRLKKKHPADLTKDITLQTRGWYPAGGSYLYVNITVKKFDLMSKMDKL